MPNWIELNAEELNPDEHRDIRGVQISVGLSPYDVPEKVRGYYDVQIRRLVIQFSYLDDEEKQISRRHDDHITLKVGENTGRLYAVQMDVDNMGVSAVLVQVKQAIEQLTDQELSSVKKRHYKVAKEVVSEHADELLAGVGG